MDIKHSFMLQTGNQLKAARALIAMTQADLAAAGGVGLNTIRALEAQGGAPLKGHSSTIRKLSGALENAGVTFLQRPAVGVKLNSGAIRAKHKTTPHET